jgi:hypothetical protein
MTSYSSRMTTSAAIGAASLLMSLAGSAVAAPAIQATSGTLDHKATVTITGTGFGTKATAAPVVWDDASGTNLLSKWDGAWPSNNPTYNTGYRAPMRGIGLPHSNITRYIAGADAENLGYNAGWNVIFYKNRTMTSFPAYTYASWYHRADNAWTFCGDNNYKSFDYSTGTSPFSASNWYLAFGPPHPGSTTDGAQWLYTDDANSLMNPDMNGHNAWWGTAVNPMAGQWTKVELEIMYTNQSNGYIKLWENGTLQLNYSGPTDKYSGTARSEGVGGFARCNYTNNWRYWADVYLDYTPARVVLANNSNLANATIIETQIPANWTANSIGISVNLGKFAAGQPAYLFVFDSTGTHNATGFQVTAGKSGGTALPPPTNLHTL